MKFNIVYFGPEHLFNLRRDFFLLLKFGLESVGHQVTLSGGKVDANSLNLLVGAYFLDTDEMSRLRRSGAAYAVINTEIVKNGLLNFQPEKTDLENAYLPLINSGKFIWDIVPQNIPELKEKYGINAQLLRWAYHEKLEDIEHKEKPDLDYYFFGFVSDRRKHMIEQLNNAGLNGFADHSCPYFIRNDRIARAKIQVNIRQDLKYVHVNNFRIGYLANNWTAILSEEEEDPTNYLQYAQVAEMGAYTEAAVDLVSGDKWRQLRDASYERYRKILFKDIVDEILDASFAEAA
jgi:hypothetical protein